MSDGSKYYEKNYSNSDCHTIIGEFGYDLKKAQKLEKMEDELMAYMQAAKSLRRENHYLVDGATLKCTHCTLKPCTPMNKEFTAPEGSDMSILKVTQNSSALNGAGQCFATVKDSEKYVNIQPFGNCKNPPDRVKEKEAIRKAEESEEMLKMGTCRHLMKLNDVWENMIADNGYEEVTGLDGELLEEISMESILFCQHGGLIYPFKSGYIMTENYSAFGLEDEIEQMTRYLRGEGISEEEINSVIDVVANECGLTVNSMIKGKFSELESKEAFERSESFDNQIIAWTYYWNNKIKNEFTYEFTIDPNIVKAMIAQESSFGLVTENNKAKNTSRNVLQSLSTGNAIVWVASGINPYENGMFNVGDKISYKMLDGSIGTDGSLAVNDLPNFSGEQLKRERQKEHFSDFDILKNIFEVGEDGKYMVNFNNVTTNMSIATGVGTLANKIEEAENIYDGVAYYNTKENYVDKINAHLADMGAEELKK